MSSTALSSTDMKDPVLSAIREKLSERLKTGFIELIPQETFDKMTDLAIDEFVNGAQHKRFKKASGYLDKDHPNNNTGVTGHVEYMVPIVDYSPVNDSSTLPGMIYLELVKLAKDSIADTLSKDERFNSKYDADLSMCIIPILNKIVSDNAPVFMQALMNNVVQYSVAQSINNLRSSQGMGGYTPPVTPGRF